MVWEVRVVGLLVCISIGFRRTCDVVYISQSYIPEKRNNKKRHKRHRRSTHATRRRIPQTQERTRHKTYTYNTTYPTFSILPSAYAPTPATLTPPPATFPIPTPIPNPVLVPPLGPTNPCLCLPVLPLPNQLYFNSLFRRPIFSCASSLDCRETSTDTHCSMRPTVSVTLVLSMGVWRREEGALDVKLLWDVGGGWRCDIVGWSACWAFEEEVGWLSDWGW